MTRNAFNEQRADNRSGRVTLKSGKFFSLNGSPTEQTELFGYVQLMNGDVINVTVPPQKNYRTTLADIKTIESR